MSLLSESKVLLESIEKVKENLGLDKNKISGTNLFNALEIRKGSALDANNESKPLVTKPKKYYFRITFIKGAIQFLDIKSCLNLSLVNKEFSYFIKSIYFYKFMSEVDIIKKKKNEKLKANKEIDKVILKKNKANGGFMGKFVGAFGSVLGKLENNIRIQFI
jgi:hypothetical protein